VAPRAKRTERLDLHRSEYEQFSGRGVVLLRFEDLTAPEKRLVARDVFSSIGRERGDPYSVYARVLASWGIMCPHPQLRRLYGGRDRHGTPQPTDRYGWFRCESCGALAQNEPPSEPRSSTKRRKA
jgi:hypothetical protein